ncbi:carbonic anhydrase 2-like [Lucilia sericata]|uniref:carbonic anhydrase 2-like n=1 Tax=Lucilia sericata TaxID=13632 RepID=UPI0018A7E9C5|nr:carbonic anhydrase 2-like [Lucilia sericata]
MKFLIKVSFFVVLVGLHKVTSYKHSNQAVWYDTDDECSLDRQSPIELNYHDAHESSGIQPITFNNYNLAYITPSPIRNNGHSADLQFSKSNVATISGGPLHNDVYKAESLHFHWGSGDNHGSEHMVGNLRYSMEMHIVHRNIKYATIAEATKHKDGLAVLGVFYNVEPSAKNFKGLSKIDVALGAIQQYNSSTLVNNLIIEKLFNTIDRNEFFTYKGSLTTPPCSRAVNWIVFPEPIVISTQQIKGFRSLFDSHGEPLVNNYRFLQAKGKRQVFFRSNNEL